MAANVVRTVAPKRDADGILFVRKATICCRTVLNLNGMWEERYLSQELQNIVVKYRENFIGQAVFLNHNLEGEATDTDFDA